MTDLGKQLSRTHDLSGKVAQLFQKRAQTAQQRFTERVQNAYAKHVADLVSKPMSPWDIWTDWSRYAVDFTQRSTLFWDAIRQRGNQYLEHTRAGQPPVLHFDYEVVLDARTFDKPVNYALLRIVPPQGVTVDPKRRPYVIIDPRAGHGPGIGGFKDDSQVGVALREVDRVARPVGPDVPRGHRLRHQVGDVLRVRALHALGEALLRGLRALLEELRDLAGQVVRAGKLFA